MSDARDSSISPTARSARSPSPLTKTSPGPDQSRESQKKTASPLRLQQMAHGSMVDGANGEPLPAATLEQDAHDEMAKGPKEFPFPPCDGAPGEATASQALPGVRHAHTDSSATGRSSLRALDTTNDPAGAPSVQLPPIRKPQNEAGSTTPTGRRSVQFARPATVDPAQASYTRQESWAEEETQEGPGKYRQGGSLLSKLRALAGPISLQGHGRSLSSWTVGAESALDPGGPLSPASDRYEPRYADSETDYGADVEDSGGEGPSAPPRRRRKSRRFPDDGTHTAPTTPKATKLPSFFRDSPGATPTSATTPFHRPVFLRRSTMSDIPENHRQGVSEDEGRDRLAKESVWRRGLHGPRGFSYGGRRHDDPDSPRPSNLRRLTAIATGSHGSDGWRVRGERTPSAGAQKWRQLKAGLKMLGQKRKEQSRVDHAKSAELVAELLAGAPAALFLASMFQRDEHGHKRVPILLEQLKLRITDSDRMLEDKDKDREKERDKDKDKAKDDDQSGARHLQFRIELEYGSGFTRMKWVVYRTLRDFTNLHLKYKTEKYIQLNREDRNRAKLPRFPKSAFPYLRSLRGFMDLDDDEREEEEAAGTAGEMTDADGSGTDRPGKKRPHRSSLGFQRRKSSIGAAPGLTGEMAARAGSIGGAFGVPAVQRRDNYAVRQRQKLEKYLQEMITWLMFRPDSNRLCKFLELSALGVRLAAEGGYHGKEGFLTIQSGKGVDFRRAWKPSAFTKRHTPKWFLVRHSYIVCVDSPEEMNIYDVFLVDPDWSIQALRLRDQKTKDIAKHAKTSAAHPKHHLLTIQNSERKVKLWAKNERLLHQFEESIKFMVSMTPWAEDHRFDSFAPTRSNVFAQWLVDGRDYMWNVSRAISMARDVVYIHDWWLSPELYMRRPAAISKKWRLDRLLERRAKEGVKVYVIIYRNVGAAIPIDSEHTKFSLLNLHPNIFIQRSPNQYKTGTFFWAHHEKICIIDHTVAFCGGVDLCFGRWDTPQHFVTDDKLTGFEPDIDVPKDADHIQLWPGKDYSNPRVRDFSNLDRPYEEMYDRTKKPRMPWHDIGMQIVGQPARDLCRHFVQRWNYLRRQRNPNRPTPFLLPPPDFLPADLESLGLDGTCEIQILRSAGKWSLGTPDKTEHSIMNAYVKMIEHSEHFVYIENQFFITSCVVRGTKVENSIGDALVDRIIRAFEQQEDWRAVILIPLMPGFQNTVDSQDGSSVRLIMSCQYSSICRGENSIFERLRAQGIEPEDYIQFYALRSWGKIGPNKALVTEQLYIHAKVMIVDDRIAIIGSANINERSMLGHRDSEVAAIIKDTDLLPSYMGGEPYMVGRFAHTLRVRLMREHLGVDVDDVADQERAEEQGDQQTHDYVSDNSSSPSSPLSDRFTEQRLIENQNRLQDDLIAREAQMRNGQPRVDGRSDGSSTEDEDYHTSLRSFTFPSIKRSANERVSIERREGTPPESKGSPSRFKDKARDRSNTTRTRASSNSVNRENLGNADLPPARPVRMDTQTLGLTQLSQLPPLPVLDDTDIGGPPLQRTFNYDANPVIKPVLSSMEHPVVTPYCMQDPLNESFYLDTWHRIAENNTKLFRLVFRCQPDNEVKNWDAYKEYNAFTERFNQAQGIGKSKTRVQQETSGKSGPPGSNGISTAEKKVEGLSEKVSEKIGANGNGNHPLGKVEQWAEEQDRSVSKQPSSEVIDEKAALRVEDSRNVAANSQHVIATRNGTADGTASKIQRERTITYSEPPALDGSNGRMSVANVGSRKKRGRAATGRSMRTLNLNDERFLLGKEDAEEMLTLIQGHLVVWPYDWLKEDEPRWAFKVDEIAPLEIYT